MGSGIRSDERQLEGKLKQRWHSRAFELVIAIRAVMLNYISNTLVAFYFLESILSYYSQVFTLLFFKGTCSKTKYCFKFL